MSLFDRIIGRATEKQVAFIKPPETERVGSFTIVPSPVQIIPADIQRYISAFNAARSAYVQERSTIYDIYQNAIDFDPHLFGLIQKRISSTVGRELEYIVGGKPNKRAEWLMESPRFDDFIEALLMSKVFWGIGVIECYTTKWQDEQLFDFTSVNPKHIDPFEKFIRKYQYAMSSDDKSYKGKRNIIEVGEPMDFGLLQQAALYSFYKRAVMNSWAEYARLAGTNFRTIKYRGKLPDQNTMKNIEKTIAGAGTGALSLPHDIDLETQNQTSTSQNELFEGIIAYYDDAMTKLILGQTMTTEDGSSRSQAEVHERVQEVIFATDSKFVVDVLNYDFTGVASIFGLPQGGRWRYKDNTGKMMEANIATDLKLKELGYVFSQEYIAEKYGLPKPEKNAVPDTEQEED